MQQEIEMPMFIKDRRKWVRLRIQEVSWIEAADNCSILHLGNEDHIIGRTLKDVMSQLVPCGFERIHRSYAVNLQHIESIDDGGVKVAGTRLPIGRKYRAELLGKLHLI